MRKILIVLLLLSLVLPLLRGSALPEIKEYSGSLEMVYQEVKDLYGPFDQEIILEDGARLENDNYTLELLRDNYRGSDYLLFINN